MTMNRPWNICISEYVFTFCVTSSMGPKKQSFLPIIKCSQMKLPDFESPSGDSSSKSANFGFSKWIFYIKNHPNPSKKNSLKNINLGASFL